MSRFFGVQIDAQEKLMIHNQPADFKNPFLSLVVFCLLVVLFTSTASASYLMVQNGSTIQLSNNTIHSENGNINSPTWHDVLIANSSCNCSGYMNLSFQTKQEFGPKETFSYWAIKNSSGYRNISSIVNIRSDSYVYVNQSVFVTINSSEQLVLRGKSNETNGNAFYWKNATASFDYVPVPTIFTPINNSAQTSRIVNITTNATMPIQYQVSQVSGFSTLLYNATTANNYSGNLILPTGLNYIRVRGYNATEDSVTNWSNNSVYVEESAYRVYSFDINWYGFTGIPNVSNGDIRKNYTAFIMLSDEIISTGMHRQVSVDVINWNDNSSCGASIPMGFIFLAQNTSSYYMVNYIDDNTKSTCGYWQFKSFNPTVTKSTVNAVRPALNQTFRIIVDLYNSTNSTVTIQYENGTVMTSMNANTTEEGWISGKFGVRDPNGLGSMQVFDNLRYTNTTLYNESVSDSFDTTNENWTNITSTGNFVRTQINGNWLQQFTYSSSQANLIYNPRNYKDLIMSADFNRTVDGGFYGITISSGSTYLDKVNNQYNSYQIIYNSAQQALKINKIINNAQTNLVNYSYSTSSNKTYTVKTMRSGSRIYAKMWELGTIEPKWMVEVSDISFDYGFSGIRADLGNVTFDNVSIVSNTSHDIVLSKSNSYIGNSTSDFSVPALQYVNFTAIVENIGTTNWYIDGQLKQSSSSDYFNWSFKIAPITRNVTAIHTDNENTVTYIIWNVSVIELSYTSNLTSVPQLRLPIKNQTINIMGNNPYFYDFNGTWTLDNTSRTSYCASNCSLSNSSVTFYVNPINNVIIINTSRCSSCGNISVYIDDTIYNTYNTSGSGYYNIPITGLLPRNISKVSINSTLTTPFYLNNISMLQPYSALYDGTDYFQFRRFFYSGQANITDHEYRDIYNDYNETRTLADFSELKNELNTNSIVYQISWGDIVYQMNPYPNGTANNLYNYSMVDIVDRIVNNSNDYNLSVFLWPIRYTAPLDANVGHNNPSNWTVNGDEYLGGPWVRCYECLTNHTQRTSWIEMVKYLSNRYRNNTNVHFEFVVHGFDAIDCGQFSSNCSEQYATSIDNINSFNNYSGGAYTSLPLGTKQGHTQVLNWYYEKVFYDFIDEIYPTLHTNGQLVNYNLLDITELNNGEEYVTTRNVKKLAKVDFVGDAVYPDVSYTSNDSTNYMFKIVSRTKPWGGVNFFSEGGLNTNRTYNMNLSEFIRTEYVKVIRSQTDVVDFDIDSNYVLAGGTWWTLQELGRCRPQNTTYIINDCWGIKYMNGTKTSWYDDIAFVFRLFSVSSYTPLNNYENSIGDVATFSVDTSQIANEFSWYLDGLLVQTNGSTSSAKYRNSSSSYGRHNLTVYSNNGINYISQTWNWDVSYPPMSITNLQNVTTSTSINWTWTNPTDLDFDHIWFRYANGTIITEGNQTGTYLNITYPPHYTQNISAQTIDTAGNINQTKVWFNATIQNNPIIIQNVSSSYNLTAGQYLLIDANYTDLDGDTGTFVDNASEWNIDSNGLVNWTSVAGVYNWQINVSDGYGSISMQNFSVSVNYSNNINSCRNLSLPGTYTIIQNVTSAGTCFTIAANNITLNGAGYNIYYSSTSDGYGINNTNFNNITIKNIIIIQNSSNPHRDGISLINVTNSTITNSTITTSGHDASPIRLTSSNNNIVSNNTLISTGQHTSGSETLTSSNNNTISSNNITCSGSDRDCVSLENSSLNLLQNNSINTTGGYSVGIRLSGQSNSNILTNNFVLSGATGVYLFNSGNNRFSGGSIYSPNGNDYYLNNVPGNNTFNNTNFTTRKINFDSIGSQVAHFNYSNNSNIWLNTNISDYGVITRTLSNWTQSNLTWSDNVTNGTITAHYNVTGLNANTSYDVFNNSVIDYIITSDANGSLIPFKINLTTDITTIKILVSSPTDQFVPPIPINLTSTQGNFWINYTWQAGIGNITDSYNVSVNGTWDNSTYTSSHNWSNGTVNPHGWRNISVYAFNNSGNGSLNLTSVSNNTQVANNVPVLAAIGAKSIEEDQLLSFTVSATDADTDTLFYAQNGSGTINSASGAYSWTPPTPGTYYVNFTSNDSYGGLDYEVVTITVTTYTPPNLRLSGTVTPAGSTIAVTGQGQLTGGAYDFGQVFTAGSTVWVNVSKTGYYSNNSQVTFASSDIVYDVNLAAMPVNGTPNVTAWGNNYTNNASLSFFAEKGWIAFNITANQTLTGCTWTGATQINCTDAKNNFTVAGNKTVTYQGTNGNGSTQVIIWTVQVNGSSGLTLAGYVTNVLSVPLQNARVDFNGSFALTNLTGYYSFSNVNEETYIVLARQVGYKNNSVTYFINNNSLLNFTLKERGNAVSAPGFDGISLLLISLFIILIGRKK